MTTPSNATDTLAQDAALNEPLQRVAYEAGMLLGLEATRDEQAYHRRRLTRHQYWIDGYGTIAGMRVHPGNAPGRTEIRVGPGLGIDMLGREVLVGETYCIHLEEWLEHASDVTIADGLTNPGGPTDLTLIVSVRHSDCLVEPQQTLARRLNFGTDAVRFGRARDAIFLDLSTQEPRVIADGFRPWGNHRDLAAIADGDLALSDTERASIAAAAGAEARELDLKARLLNSFEPGDADPGIIAAERERRARLLLAHVILSNFSEADRSFGAVEIDNLVRPFLMTARHYAHLGA